MGNHVIYDALWLSDRLARCSKEAAMAYPAIFLVADDHGRFEYHPRRIFKTVFGYRDDVTLEEVTRWLSEYWEHGLLIRYHIDGQLAYWYKFRGRKPSERRPSDLDDPAESPEYSFSEHGATRGRRGGDEGALDKIRAEQIRAEQNTALARGERPPVEGRLNSREAAEAWQARHGDAEVPGALWKPLKRLSERFGWARVKPVLVYYLASRELDYLSWPKFASGFLTLESELRDGKPVKPGQASSQNSVREAIFASRKAEYDRENREAAERLRKRNGVAQSVPEDAGGEVVAGGDQSPHAQESEKAG